MHLKFKPRLNAIVLISSFKLNLKLKIAYKCIKVKINAIIVLRYFKNI